ncbi:MAG: LD-carboxypeptidase [Oscillospiraceae bacterium]|jgi:muramoyltetrapeptide carboxypeptidase LdcA involved in peptidoglycan recycling|nr:LD-carboxypeptidase [Oscillospiraceae bacterium]
MPLKKPAKLHPGDKIATVSLSWGCAGDADIHWRYALGVARLKSEFGLEAVPMRHALQGEDYIAKHPEARAEDLMAAFADPSLRGVIANIGGNDAIRLLPYVDFDVIRSNPKVLIGYSDTTSIHLMCQSAGLSTFYGANLLTNIADPQGLHPYSKHWFRKALFDAQPIGRIPAPGEFTCDATEYENARQVKQYHAHSGFVCLQGSGKATGRLFGGHMGSLEEATPELRKHLYTPGNILFVEDVTACMNPGDLMRFLRWLGEEKILHSLHGVVFGRFNQHPEDPAYKQAIQQVVGQEFGLTGLPILYNLPFGHTSPICMLPYGAMAEIDCDNRAFSILESGVV